MTQSNVIINNVKETRRSLTKFAPEVKKALDKANREAGAPLVALAKNNFTDVPMTNWGRWIAKKDGRNLSWSQGDAQKGIKIKQRGRAKKSPWSGVLQIRNETAVGAIYEMAGRRNQPSTPQGAQFIRNLQNIKTVPIKGLSRGIWAAIKEYPVKKYTDQVVENYAAAEKELQQTLDRMSNT